MSSAGGKQLEPLIGLVSQIGDVIPEPFARELQQLQTNGSSGLVQKLVGTLNSNSRPAKGAVWPVSELAPLRNLAHGSVRADPKRQRGKEDRTVETLGSESIHPTLPRAATQPPRLRSALANRAPAASPLLALPLLSKNWMRSAPSQIGTASFPSPHPPPPTIAGSDFACFLSFQGI